MIWKMRMINEMNWGWFKVPVNGEQMNAYLFSDTTMIKKNKKWKENESIARSVQVVEEGVTACYVDFG